MVLIKNNFNFQEYYFLSELEIVSISLDPDNWILNQVDEFVNDESFSFSVISAISELEKDLITIENPFQESILIKLKKENKIESISVVNSTGTAVFKMDNFIANDFSLNSSQWTKGIYFITITSNKREQTIKLLKN